MARTSVSADSTTVRKPPMRPSFVLGSRPGTLRANPVPRIKPMAGQTNYGKQNGQSNPAGAGFGDTGMTGLS